MINSMDNPSIQTRSWVSIHPKTLWMDTPLKKLWISPFLSMPNSAAYRTQPNLSGFLAEGDQQSWTTSQANISTTTCRHVNRSCGLLSHGYGRHYGGRCHGSSLDTSQQPGCSHRSLLDVHPFLELRSNRRTSN
jgi:hypothetical protein